MSYVFYNPNPRNQKVGDCSVRAVCRATDSDWEETYLRLCAEGLIYCDMPSANYVWGMYLRKCGFRQKMIDNVCPDCTTVAQFAEEHPDGIYVLACQNHVVTADNGCYFDSWDSGDEIVLYFFEKEI